MVSSVTLRRVFLFFSAVSITLIATILFFSMSYFPVKRFFFYNHMMDYVICGLLFLLKLFIKKNFMEILGYKMIMINCDCMIN